MTVARFHARPARPLRAVAWDIDGTLIDSEPLHHRALLAACGALGTDLADLPEQAFRGIHIGDVFHELRHRLPQETTQDGFVGAVNRFYVENRHGLVLLPGAVATIRRLADRGIAQVCVSNSSRSVVDANIAALGIADALAFSISLDDVTNGKPDPEPYATACARLGLPGPEVMAVEDSHAGASAARAAGLYTVGFTPTGGGFGAVDAEVAELPALLELFDAQPA